MKQPPRRPLTLSDFDFELPPELIAQFPVSTRSGSRMLHLDAGGKKITDRLFSDLPNHLKSGDLLVFNNTRVIKARLHGIKESGGKIEVLVERVLDAHHVLAHIRASHSPKPGSRLILENFIQAGVLDRQDGLFHLVFEGPEAAFDLLERHGRLPLPPYIEHDPNAQDESRYQTVYAREPGAVAAPTAGLHFDQAMLDRLAEMGIQTAFVTLHVGAGTFQPVRVENILEHSMHGEWYHVPEETVSAIERTRQAGGSIMAIGTTSVRALESAAASGELKAGYGETHIFITPGYRFRVIDRLMTNFHLPKSTLLMLVSAFAGMVPIRNAYQHAIEQGYRFFSYGDAMLIEIERGDDTT